MWFGLSVFAMTLLAARRTQEKQLAGSISSLAMAWLQQGIALPFIILTLFFAKFYWPSELPTDFWVIMAFYVFFGAIDLYCYFKALSMADVSYVAPLMSLVAVANVVGAYFVLGQKPTLHGLLGAALIVCGAYLVNRAKRGDIHSIKTNRLALFLILLLVIIRGFYSNIEVFMLRDSNPTTFNFYSSVLTVPFVLLISMLFIRKRRTEYINYWPDLAKGVRKHYLALAFVGVTYTINMIATYQAKILSPDAGYVGAIKSASVLPVVLIGIFFLNEKVVRMQWVGLCLIIAGLALLAMN